MIGRLRARLALLQRHVGDAHRRAQFDAARGVEWLWNRIKTLPGVQQVGHGIASVFGLYRLDVWWAEQERCANLRLADQLEAAGLPDQARKLRRPPRL